ncbi:MAG: 1-acyl-sn-glycerol-3-phosphate acyltransferase [Chloroflexota bacterium]
MENLATTRPIDPQAEVSPLTQRLARFALRVWGWEVEAWEVPDDMKKVVIAGEHHTSNVDGFLMVLITAAMGRKLSWLVKEELNQPVIGGMIRASGGIFVDRHAPKGTVGEAIDRINESEHIFLVMAPSSTRKKTDKWRSGFYYMALGAEVPIGLGYIDYARKKGGVGKVIVPSGDIKADEPIFQQFFENVTALHPEQVSTVRLDPPAKLPKPEVDSTVHEGEAND